MRIFRIIRLVLVFILEWNHNEKNYQRTTNVCPSLSRRILDPSAYGFGMRSWSFSSTYAEELWVEIGPDGSWITFCSCVNESTLFSFSRSLLRDIGRSLRFPNIFIKKQTRWSNDKTIIDSDCQCLADQDILLNLNRPMIVKYPSQCILNDSLWEADQYSAIIRKFKHRRTFESVDRQFWTKPTIDNDNREL